MTKIIQSHNKNWKCNNKNIELITIYLLYSTSNPSVFSTAS